MVSRSKLQQARLDLQYSLEVDIFTVFKRLSEGIPYNICRATRADCEESRPPEAQSGVPEFLSTEKIHVWTGFFQRNPLRGSQTGAKKWNMS
jgi:hypothetical protein